MSAPEQGPVGMILNPCFDPDFLASKGIEKTKNKNGYMFLKIGESAKHWLSSLPHSDKPVLDLGAAYGVHTLHALRAGRDAIAIDVDAGHIEELERRAGVLLSAPPAADSKPFGRLVRAITAALPAPDVLGPESVSAVLISEVFHFLRPGQPLPIMRDAFRWLEPGGKLVTTSASSLYVQYPVASGQYEFLDGRTVEEAIAMQNGTDEELVENPPTFLQLTKDSSAWRTNCGNLYLLSIKEVTALARLAGFEVERAEYISLGKYADLKEGMKNEEVLLIARKPL